MASTTRHNQAGRGTPSQRRIERDRATLLELLAAIDRESWDGPTASELLLYLRTKLVRPLTIDVGLRGAMASQAEASGWEAVWTALTKPALREAHSPWGVLWHAARTAVLGEIVACRFATAERRAWELSVEARNGELRVPISLEALVESGWEPADRTAQESSCSCTGT